VRRPERSRFDAVEAIDQYRDVGVPATGKAENGIAIAKTSVGDDHTNLIADRREAHAPIISGLSHASKTRSAAASKRRHTQDGMPLSKV
jgi:hypothetical protein